MERPASFCGVGRCARIEGSAVGFTGSLPRNAHIAGRREAIASDCVTNRMLRRLGQTVGKRLLPADAFAVRSRRWWRSNRVL